MDSNFNTAVLLLQKLEKTKIYYQGFFDKMDSLRKSKAIPHDCSFVPRQVVEEQLTTCRDYTDREFVLYSASKLITPLYAWRYHKKIYQFDPDLIDVLVSQDISTMPMDSEFFQKLPFNGLCMHLEHGDDYNLSCFVCNDGDTDFGKLTFYLLNMNRIKDEMDGKLEDEYFIGCMTFELLLSTGKTIGECIDATNIHFNKSDRDRHTNVLMHLTNLLMYILSCNADLGPIQSSRNNKEFTNWKQKSWFREVELQEVGFNIGQAIRLHKEAKWKSHKEGREGSSSERVPHVRCGHWHRYWTGSKKSPEGQKITIKWIPPIFVNGYIGGEGHTSNVSHVHL